MKIFPDNLMLNTLIRNPTIPSIFTAKSLYYKVSKKVSLIFRTRKCVTLKQIFPNQKSTFCV